MKVAKAAVVVVEVVVVVVVVEVVEVVVGVFQYCDMGEDWHNCYMLKCFKCYYCTPRKSINHIDDKIGLGKLKSHWVAQLYYQGNISLP